MASSFHYRVCLDITGVCCDADAVPLERALSSIDGVGDALVNAPRSRVWVEVDVLPRLQRILRLLSDRGYSVDTTEVHVITWIPEVRSFQTLRGDLLRIPHVTYCVGTAMGRVRLGFACRPGWEEALKEVCDRLCRAVAEKGVEEGGPGDGWDLLDESETV